MLFNASKDLENCGGAQYLYFICIVYIGSLAAAGVFTIPFISDVFFLAVCYVNCRKNRDSKIALMGLPFSVSAAYIPYIFLAFGFSYANIVGICFGHVYYFFEEVYPKLLKNSFSFIIINIINIFLKNNFSSFLKIHIVIVFF